jgi:hypothetical protein
MPLRSQSLPFVPLFPQILDSSIWLQDHATLRVWITLLASADDSHVADFSTIRNLAHRARVTFDECAVAVRILEGPDPHSAIAAHEGRRIERVNGGWKILNGDLYDAMSGVR